MVNYVLSFCKITGASKIFKRNFYLPLLKPLTPREALRTLRITGKWLLGAKYQHYIPVLLNHTQQRSKQTEDYGKLHHEKSDDYTYMTPVLDPENENHKILINLLEAKESNGMYVYTVNDKKYNIVFSTQFEVALRNGEIIDVLVSQKNDKILVKMKDRKKIPMEIHYFEGDSDNLYTGEAATDEEQEKHHHHGKYTMALAQQFEEKEMREEKWEEALRKILKRRKKVKWENSKAYKEMMKRNMKNMNWNKFEEEAKKVIDEIEEPTKEEAIEMEVEDLEATKNVNETILGHGEGMLNQLPTLTEIPDIIKNMGSASLHEIEASPSDEQNKGRRVSGIKVTLPSGKECFVSGQMVLTEEGEVFVPGQTVHNEFGDEYVPGITTVINNQPTLVSGLILGEQDQDPLFLPSQSSITADGTLTFTSNPEERPEPPAESERKVKRKKKEPEIIEIIEATPTTEKENPFENYDFVIICDSDSESEDKSAEVSSEELNNSELEELDIEAIRLRQEQHRLELEKLNQQLFDDMSDIISNLEDKKAELKRKLDELRKKHMDNQNNLVTYVNEKDAMEVASKITEDKDLINRLSDILLTMTRRSATFRDKNSVRSDNINIDCPSCNASDAEISLNQCTNKLRALYKTALVAANDVFKNRPKDQLLALTTIGNILCGPLKNDSKLLKELINIMKTQIDRDEICNAAFKQLTQAIEDTKVAMLNKIVEEEMSTLEFNEIVEKILGSENIMNVAFQKITKLEHSIIKNVVENISNQLAEVKMEEDAVRVLQKSIVKAVKAMVDDRYAKISYNDFKDDAISFAKALDMEDVIDDLQKSRNFSEQTTDLLKRVLLMRQIAERDYSLRTAITRIKKNPEVARSDPRIRQLIRESGCLVPMHMMSAIQVNKNREKRIDDYLSGVRERDDTSSYSKNQQSNVRRLRKIVNRRKAA
ncbi:unnamed protein product [Acanthoscelides obtectus]|uniref:Uncharacterized protein n=1 Tax=Acanthoscelides obtectus TaxID=200917 RepID=A0A9P0LYW4_ACAOB|nr:unnamed protein product [Acanthoscelides obtectus]CAK1659861.1 hypothetical protein AOBTE_LOCUS21714 [Acanthoscelides obtectus]